MLRLAGILALLLSLCDGTQYSRMTAPTYTVTPGAFSHTRDEVSAPSASSSLLSTLLSYFFSAPTPPASHYTLLSQRAAYYATPHGRRQQGVLAQPSPSSPYLPMFVPELGRRVQASYAPSFEPSFEPSFVPSYLPSMTFSPSSSPSSSPSTSTSTSSTTSSSESPSVSPSLPPPIPSPTSLASKTSQSTPSSFPSPTPTSSPLLSTLDWGMLLTFPATASSGSPGRGVSNLSTSATTVLPFRVAFQGLLGGGVNASQISIRAVNGTSLAAGWGVNGQLPFRRGLQGGGAGGGSPSSFLVGFRASFPSSSTPPSTLASVSSAFTAYLAASNATFLTFSSPLAAPLLVLAASSACNCTISIAWDSTPLLTTVPASPSPSPVVVAASATPSTTTTTTRRASSSPGVNASLTTPDPSPSPSTNSTSLPSPTLSTSTSSSSTSASSTSSSALPPGSIAAAVVVPLLALGVGLALFFYWRRGGSFKGILLSSEVKPPKDSKGVGGGDPLEEGGGGKALKFSDNPMGPKAGRTPLNPLLEPRGSSKLATSPILLDLEAGANTGGPKDKEEERTNPLVRASISMGSNNPSISAPLAAQAITEGGPTTPVEPPPPTPTTPAEPPP